MSEATLRRLDRAAMQGVALVVMAVMLTRLMLLPAMAEAREGQILICGSSGMTWVSVGPGDAPEPADQASCAEHCVLTVEFDPTAPMVLPALVAQTPVDARLEPLGAPPLRPRSFRSRAPPFIA